RTDDAPPLLFFGHERGFVERSTDLVRADALKQFGLQAHVESGALAQLSRGEQRRAFDVRRDARANLAEVTECEREHSARLACDHCSAARSSMRCAAFAAVVPAVIVESV